MRLALLAASTALCVLALFLAGQSGDGQDLEILYGVTAEDQSPTLPDSFEKEESESKKLFKTLERQVKEYDAEEAKIDKKAKAVAEFVHDKVRLFL